VRIRPASPADEAAIDAVEREAFGRADEAGLVRRLRIEGAVLVESVAEDAGAVVGHVLFTRLSILRDGETVEAAALAPLAVASAARRRGVGAALARGGLEDCRRFGAQAVVVLGDPAYYGRFGFSAALARPLSAPFSGPAFMALELVPGALGRGGTVRYAAAFGL